MCSKKQPFSLLLLDVAAACTLIQHVSEKFIFLVKCVSISNTVFTWQEWSLCIKLR